MQTLNQLRKEVKQLQKRYDTSVDRSVYIIGPKLRAKQEELQAETITELSKAFGAVLKEWLTADQMESAITSNREDINASWCASHDFCDANMAMDEAFQKVMQREFVFFNDEQPETEQQNGEDTDLISAAWTLAKENDFYYENKG